jgi:uncharacterized protein (TIGR00288 family)
MDEKLQIAVYIDYDNIEIGVKSTLQRELDVAAVLESLKERGDIVAKFAYADWGRQEGAKRQMAENAVQMVQRVPNPRGDKNGADINLALDALEMAFTHTHINAFAIVSGDSDFIPLVNKLKEYGKTIFVIGGKAFTSTILQKNCHEFISFESLIDAEPQRPQARPQPSQHAQQPQPPQQPQHPPQRRDRQPRNRPAPLDLAQAMPLVERALQVLDRRAVTPQLGLLKSTMLQLDPAFTEKAYGSSTFTDFVEKLSHAGYIDISGSEGRYVISRKAEAKPEEPAFKPEEALPMLRDVLETHRIEMDNGCTAEDLESWVRAENPEFDPRKFGFQEFAEVLNFAQDKLVVRIVPDEEKGLMVYLGAEFYPPAPPEPTPEELAAMHIEVEEKQPETNETPALMQPPPKRKRTRKAAGETGTRRTTRTRAAGTTTTRTQQRRAPRKRAAPPDQG